MVIQGHRGVPSNRAVRMVRFALPIRATATYELLSKVVYGLIMRRRDPGVLHLRI